jgi:hypothetical protein
MGGFSMPVRAGGTSAAETTGPALIPHPLLPDQERRLGSASIWIWAIDPKWTGTLRLVALCDRPGEMDASGVEKSDWLPISEERLGKQGRNLGFKAKGARNGNGKEHDLPLVR